MLRFADNVHIVVQDEANLKLAIERMDNIQKEIYGMAINMEKTKMMVCSKDLENILSIWEV